MQVSVGSGLARQVRSMCTNYEHRAAQELANHTAKSPATTPSKTPSRCDAQHGPHCETAELPFTICRVWWLNACSATCDAVANCQGGQSHMPGGTSTHRCSHPAGTGKQSTADQMKLRTENKKPPPQQQPEIARPLSC